MDSNQSNNPTNQGAPNPNIRVHHVNSLEEAEEARKKADEDAQNGISSITYVNYEMSQERVNALMNRLARRAALVNGTQAGEEVRKIMGDAMMNTFGDAGSDNEGNSSEEERDYRNRIGGGRGNGGGGRG